MGNEEEEPKFPDDLPFGEDVIEKIKKGEVKYEDIWEKGGKYEEKGDIYSDKNKAIWADGEYKNADKEGKIVYRVEEFDKTKHNGKTKKEILEEEKEGFEIKFIERNPNIPREGKGKEKKGRKQIEAGKEGKEYLRMLKEEEMYKGEEGITPEDQIMYGIMYLEETNQVIDDYDGKGSCSWQTGAYFLASGLVPFASWDRFYRRVYLVVYVSTFPDSDTGSRGAAKIKGA